MIKSLLRMTKTETIGIRCQEGSLHFPRTPYQCHDLRRYFKSKLVPIWVTFEHTCASHLASWDAGPQHIFNSIRVLIELMFSIRVANRHYWYRFMAEVWLQFLTRLCILSLMWMRYMCIQLWVDVVYGILTQIGSHWYGEQAAASMRLWDLLAHFTTGMARRPLVCPTRHTHIQIYHAKAFEVASGSSRNKSCPTNN